MTVYRLWLRNWIVWAGVAVHTFWGAVLLFNDAPLHTTPLGLFRHIPLLDQQYVASGIYLGSSACAFLTLVRPGLDDRFLGLILCLPQQFLLMMSFFGTLAAIAHGQNPDGYVPVAYHNPGFFILVDRMWPLVAMGVHTIALIDWYWWSRRDTD